MTFEGVDPGALVAGPLRYLAAGLALVSLAGWIVSAVHQWHVFTPRQERVSISVGVLLFALSIALIEAAQRAVDPVWAVLGIAVALAALVAALIYPDRPL